MNADDRGNVQHASTAERWFSIGDIAESGLAIGRCALSISGVVLPMILWMTVPHTHFTNIIRQAGEWLLIDLRW